MPIRTSVAEVRKIIETDIPDDQVQAFLTTASVTVDQLLGSNTVLTEETKTEIEKWLTAHGIASTVTQQLSEAGGGVTRVKFQGETGQGLRSTMYGQYVIDILDTTGIFAEQHKEDRQQFVFFSVGGEEDY